MPFSAEFLTQASRAVTVKSLDTDFQIVRNFIDKAVANVAKATGMFFARDVKVYLHGSYANNTNIYFPSALEIAVEIKHTQEFDGTQSKKQPDSKNLSKTTPDETKAGIFRVFNNYFVDIELEFGPQQFRDLLFEELAQMTGTKCFEKDKTINFAGISTVKHEISITPCFTFKFENEAGENHSGVMLYDRGTNANIVTFPRIHSENGQVKDLACAGNFKKCVRIFKTINALNVKEFGFLDEKTATGYFIECLLYNVPNELYKGTQMREIFAKVINYLMHCDIAPFVCQNLVWQLFGTAREFWQIKSAEKFLSSILNLWRIFPPSRDFIA